MASIQARKNNKGEITSYKVVVSLGYDDYGNKIRETITYHPEATTPAKQRKEVEQFAAEFERSVHDGTAFTSGNRITFSKFVQYWIDNSLSQKVLAETMTKHTKEDYIRIMDYHVIPYIGNMKINDIKAVHIDRIVTDLLDSGKSAKTIRNIFNCIRSCFDYGFRKGLIKENPCLRCEPLPVIRRDSKLHTWNESQVHRFLTDALTREYEVQIKGSRRRYKEIGAGEEFTVNDYIEHRSISFQFQVYFTIAIYSGFRRGEMIALNWDDVDLEKQLITIRKSVSLSDDGQYMKCPKTEAGNRTIKLPRVCFSLLEKWKTEQKRLCLTLGSAWQGYRGRDFDKNPIFIQPDTGERMNLQTPTKKFEKIIRSYNREVNEEEQLPVIRLHDLRHTCASHLVASGVDFETIAHRLGHSKPSFTLDVYGHALQENDDKASDILEERFSF